MSGYSRKEVTFKYDSVPEDPMMYATKSFYLTSSACQLLFKGRYSKRAGESGFRANVNMEDATADWGVLGDENVKDTLSGKSGRCDVASNGQGRTAMTMVSPSGVTGATWTTVKVTLGKNDRPEIETGTVEVFCKAS